MGLRNRQSYQDKHIFLNYGKTGLMNFI